MAAARHSTQPAAPHTTPPPASSFFNREVPELQGSHYLVPLPLSLFDSLLSLSPSLFLSLLSPLTPLSLSRSQLGRLLQTLYFLEDFFQYDLFPLYFSTTKKQAHKQLQSQQHKQQKLDGQAQDKQQQQEQHVGYLEASPSFYDPNSLPTQVSFHWILQTTRANKRHALLMMSILLVACCCYCCCRCCCWRWWCCNCSLLVIRWRSVLLGLTGLIKIPGLLWGMFLFVFIFHCIPLQKFLSPKFDVTAVTTINVFFFVVCRELQRVVFARLLSEVWT